MLCLGHCYSSHVTSQSEDNDCFIACHKSWLGQCSLHYHSATTFALKPFVTRQSIPLTLFCFVSPLFLPLFLVLFLLSSCGNGILGGRVSNSRNASRIHDREGHQTRLAYQVNVVAFGSFVCVLLCHPLCYLFC